jgi:hypothetical protein
MDDEVKLNQHKSKQGPCNISLARGMCYVTGLAGWPKYLDTAMQWTGRGWFDHRRWVPMANARDPRDGE